MDKNANGPIPPFTIRCKQTKLDNHLPATKTSFEWRVAGGQMVVLDCMLSGSVLPNISMKWGKGVGPIFFESNNNCGWLRGDTQCDHPTTSFN